MSSTPEPKVSVNIFLTVLEYLWGLLQTAGSLLLALVENYKLETVAIILDAVLILWFDILTKNNISLAFVVITLFVNIFLGYKLSTNSPASSVLKDLLRIK
jgi:hypothetical protein